MSTETEIQTEVEALKARMSDTKTLYREVCALLFFRHGITPTTNKLYQYVRRGSMSAPSDALANFWDDLRNKARIEIDHPDLPDDVKESAAVAIAGIWRQASAAAREELRTVREEAEARVETIRSEMDAMQQQHASLTNDIHTVRAQLASAIEAGERTRTELDSERRSHAASAGRIQELQRTIEDLRAQSQRQQDGFSADLDKAREAVEQANQRADAGERRAMLEIDQERQARGRAEKAHGALRQQAAQTEERYRVDLQAATESGARAVTRADALEEANRALQTRCDHASASEESLRSQLQTRSDELARARTEAETLRGVIDRLSPAGAAPAGKSARPRKA
jgi:chromosome segregation ATPase